MPPSDPTGTGSQYYLLIGSSDKATDDIESFLSTAPFPAYQKDQIIFLSPRLPDDGVGPAQKYKIKEVFHSISRGDDFLVHRTYLTVARHLETFIAPLSGVARRKS